MKNNGCKISVVQAPEPVTEESELLCPSYSCAPVDRFLCKVDQFAGSVEDYSAR
jgi:hypothetical protein